MSKPWRLGVALVMLALVAIAGCTQDPITGGEETPTTAATHPPGYQIHVGLVTDKAGLGDQSFNDSAYAGLQRAQKELGMVIGYVQPKEDADYAKDLVAEAQNGNDIVFAVGFLLTDAVKEVAPRFPNVKFALIDGVLDRSIPNVVTLNFKEEEGSFLAGALAGLMTKTNKVGFIGGMEIPLIVKFESGYRAGVQTTNPQAQVLIGYTGNFGDPGKGKEMALSQYNQGADVIYHASGACGKGVIEAAKDHGAGAWAIGVDSNQDYMGTADPSHPAPPGRVLTSMVKRVDNAVFATLKDFKDGIFIPGRRNFGLREGGVGLTDFKYSKDQIPSEVLQKVSALQAMLTLTIPSTHDELSTFKPLVPAPPAAWSTPGNVPHE
ncbi:MAG: BMP family lipoprotein [Candidatus Xenobia bacterium]